MVVYVQMWGIENGVLLILLYCKLDKMLNCDCLRPAAVKCRQARDDAGLEGLVTSFVSTPITQKHAATLISSPSTRLVQGSVEAQVAIQTSCRGP